MKQSGSAPQDYVARNPGKRLQAALTAASTPKDVDYAVRHDKGELRDANLRINGISTFINARPEFSGADTLRLELAGRLAAVGRIAEAKRQLELLPKAAMTPERSLQIEAFRRYLAENQGDDGKVEVP
jgi:hypothetical protein